MYDDKVDEFLREACQKNKEELLEFGPDFTKIEKVAFLAYTKRRKHSRSRLVLRVIAACAAALVLANAFLLFAEIEPVNAYKKQVKKLVFNLFSSDTDDSVEAEFFKQTNEIQKLQKQVPFTIPAPGWIPPDYVFESVDMTSDGNNGTRVELEYSNGQDSLLIDISDDNSISNTLPSTDEGGREVVSINGVDVYLVSLTAESRARSKCFFYTKKGLSVYISGSIDKQSLIKVVESMK